VTSRAVRHDPADLAPTNRAEGIGAGLTWLATWSLRVLLVAGASYVVYQALGALWTVIFPVLLALLLASVLWPPTAWLRRRMPPALAAAVVLLTAVVLLFGTLAALAPSVTSQVTDIASQAAGGLRQLQGYVTGEPLNLESSQVDTAVNAVTQRLQSSASTLASGVLTGVTAVGSALVTGALVLILTFFFLKDGPRFLPWLDGIIGQSAARHANVVLARSWSTLGSFIQGQALVGLVDAVLIGIGLVVCGVPLALPLAVLTFFGGFVPIIGAFVVGALAVLIALVTKGLTTALIILGVIIAVQQIEGNVLQPILQGKSLRLHPGVVILAVAAGSALYGVAGAFLSVPVAAVAAVVLRYLSEVLDGRSGPEAVSATDAEADADAGQQEADERKEEASSARL
jgi:predicted PurR-regulated permease PerM